MASPFLRPAVSALLLGLCLWAGWSYVDLPDRAPAAAAPAQPAAVDGEISFHAPQRYEVPVPAGAGQSPCQDCHGLFPHGRSPGRRAFLNLHTPAMDCGACHLAGATVAVRRFREGEAVTRESLTAGEGGRLYAARREGERWTRVLTAGGSEQFRPVGPRCTECHRRGSTFLAGEGLYDPYRRRVLEDLAVLRRMGDRE
ncbi:MAG: hypothetical protein IH608_01485 [Proteobacteria bacterium]|nr:hypothetical protein [Pseudomonadota bacterium]